MIFVWLLKNACQRYLHWCSLNFSPELLGISLSIKELENTHAIYRLSQILQELKSRNERLN